MKARHYPAGDSFPSLPMVINNSVYTAALDGHIIASLLCIVSASDLPYYPLRFTVHAKLVMVS